LFKRIYRRGKYKTADCSTREEIKNIIEAIRNPKHKLIISLAYSAGLRISEVVNLKIKDVNLEENFCPRGRDKNPQKL